MNSFAWQGRPEQAKEHWEQALKLLAMCSLPRCLEFEESVAAALKPERLAELAKVLAQHGQHERAEAHFKVVAELNKLPPPPLP
jgi:tetratricopeptide (TPR) repeat protein